MKRPSAPLSSGLLCLAAAAATALCPASLQAKEADGAWIEVGPAYAWLETGPARTELAGVHVGAQTDLATLAMFELSARAGYTYLESVEAGALHRHAGGADLLLSGSLLGILTPYAGLGVGVVQSNGLAYTGTEDAQAGGTVEAGLGITVVPALLQLTPSVRYFRADKLETATYSLDAQLHLSFLGVGVRGEYEDNLSRDGNLTTVMAYATLRF